MLVSLARRPQDVGAVAPSSGEIETRPGRFPVADIPPWLECVLVFLFAKLSLVSSDALVTSLSTSRQRRTTFPISGSPMSPLSPPLSIK